MFNRALQLSVVKKSNKTDTNTPAECTHVDHVDEYTSIAMYHAQYAAKMLFAAVVAKKLLNTACEIAVITANAKIK